MYLLDTNILSELMRKKADPVVARRLISTRSELLYASEITRYELRNGAALDPRFETIWHEIEERILPLPTWLPVGREVSVATADLDAHLTRRGRRIETTDVLIAGTALAFDLILVTRNVRHFSSVPGLTVENWFPDSAAGD